MTREEAIKTIKTRPSFTSMTYDERKQFSEALEVAMKSLEAWEGVKQDLYKFANGSFDAECAECYRIALRCIEGHLKEAKA